MRTAIVSDPSVDLPPPSFRAVTKGLLYFTEMYLQNSVLRFPSIYSYLLQLTPTNSASSFPKEKEEVLGRSFMPAVILDVSLMTNC